MKRFTDDVIETSLNDLELHIADLLKGITSAILVKSVLPRDLCERIYANFVSSKGIYRRTDGVSGDMVGTNAFLKDPGDIIQDYLTNNAHAELLFHGAPNVYRHLYDKVEDAGYRFRHAYIHGVLASTYRATVWNDSSDEKLVLKAHTDWPQVANSGLEYSDVAHPVAVNFYPKHPAGTASRLRLYDFVPSSAWLGDRGILLSGYPIDLGDVTGVDYVDIVPEEGDMLLFAASKVHAVFNSAEAGDIRLNINGFIGLSGANGRVLAWA